MVHDCEGGFSELVWTCLNLSPELMRHSLSRLICITTVMSTRLTLGEKTKQLLMGLEWVGEERNLPGVCRCGHKPASGLVWTHRELSRQGDRSHLTKT
jgi:hypothetical protein